ncbi:MAG: hypothetical protein QXW97_01155 [Candidatus Pacearchaeota archaeon]
MSLDLIKIIEREEQELPHSGLKNISLKDIKEEDFSKNMIKKKQFDKIYYCNNRFSAAYQFLLDCIKENNEILKYQIDGKFHPIAWAIGITLYSILSLPINPLSPYWFSFFELRYSKEDRGYYL